jgi:hypothetical protein
MGRATTSSPGGTAPGFADSVELWMSRADNMTDTPHRGGRRIRIKTGKNSLGPDKKSLDVDLLWRIYRAPDEVNGGEKIYQKTHWDWYGASIRMLLHVKTKYKEIGKELGEIVDIHDATRNRAWSDELGVSRDSPVDYTTLGAMLENRQDLLVWLYPCLMIQKRTTYRPGVPYRTQIDEADAKFDEGAYAHYPTIDLSEFASISTELDSVSTPLGRGDDDD